MNVFKIKWHVFEYTDVLEQLHVRQLRSSVANPTQNPAVSENGSGVLRDTNILTAMSLSEEIF